MNTQSWKNIHQTDSNGYGYFKGLKQEGWNMGGDTPLEGSVQEEWYNRICILRSL